MTTSKTKQKENANSIDLTALTKKIENLAAKCPLVEKPRDTLAVINGYPYLVFDQSPKKKPTGFGLKKAVSQSIWLGVGVVVAGEKPTDAPEIVLPFGVCWSLLTYRGLSGDPLDQKTADFSKTFAEIKANGHKEGMKYFAKPDQDFLPNFAAFAFYRIIKNALGIECRFSRRLDLDRKPARALVLSLDENSFADKKAVQTFAESMTWYLPPGRRLELIGEGNLPQRSWVSLLERMTEDRRLLAMWRNLEGPAGIAKKTNNKTAEEATQPQIPRSKSSK